VALIGFARISSRPAWYHCSIRLRCGGIRLRPNLFTPGVVSLRYSASLYFSGVSQGVVVVLVHGGREIGLWREIICNFNQLRVTLQAICAPPAVPPPWGSHLSQIRRTEEQNKQKYSQQGNFAQESREQSSGAGKRSTTLGGEARHHPFFPSCRGMVKVRRHRSLAPVSLSRCHWDHRQGRGVCRSRDAGCDPGLLPGGSVGVPGNSEAL